jgi:hypothetical protein
LPRRSETRLALMMVSGFERGGASVRLVQDLGRPEDGGSGAVAAEPPKCGRDRPPGSRSKPKMS